MPLHPGMGQSVRVEQQLGLADRELDLRLNRGVGASALTLNTPLQLNRGVAASALILNTPLRLNRGVAASALILNTPLPLMPNSHTLRCTLTHLKTHLETYFKACATVLFYRELALRLHRGVGASARLDYTRLHPHKHT